MLRRGPFFFVALLAFLAHLAATKQCRDPTVGIDIDRRAPPLLAVSLARRASLVRQSSKKSLTSSTDLDITKSWGRNNKHTYETAVRVPSKPDGDVTILLHGNGGNGQGMVRQFQSLLPDDILVAPTGYQNAWNIVEEHDAPDISFLSELVDKLGTYANVDSVRILGVSNGGALTLRAAVELDQKVIKSLVSIVSSLNTDAYHDGSFWGGNDYEQREKPAKKRDILLVQNTNDPLIPYEGGRGKIPGTVFLPALESAFVLAESQGFRGEALGFDDGNQDAQSPNVYTYTYSTNNKGGRVEHVRSDARHGMNEGIKRRVAGFLGY